MEFPSFGIVRSMSCFAGFLCISRQESTIRRWSTSKKYTLLLLCFATSSRRSRIVLADFATNRQSAPGSVLIAFVEKDAELALCGSLPARKR